MYIYIYIYIYIFICVYTYGYVYEYTMDIYALKVKLLFIELLYAITPNNQP